MGWWGMRRSEEGLEGKEEYFEVDVLFNGEAVEGLGNGSDVVWVRRWAAEFWTSWSLWREWEEIPVRREEQEEMNLWSRGREAVSDLSDAVEVGGLDD